MHKISQILSQMASEATSSDTGATIASPAVSTADGDQGGPTCIVVLGMAGSGKTTFVQVRHSCCYSVE